MTARLPACSAACRSRIRHAAAAPILVLALLVDARPAAAFTPSRHEACCLTVSKGQPDPALCGAVPPTPQTCTETIEAMARAAAARHAQGLAPAASPDTPRTTTRDGGSATVQAVVRWIGIALAAALAVLALRWIGARRILRFAAAAAAFATVTLGGTWGLWAAACAYLRCVDTMGLGILIVALLPATAIAAWVASRVWRRLAPSRR